MVGLQEWTFPYISAVTSWLMNYTSGAVLIITMVNVGVWGDSKLQVATSQIPMGNYSEWKYTNDKEPI